MTTRRLAPLLKALATSALVAGSVSACGGGGGGGTSGPDSPAPSPPSSPPSSPPASPPPASPPTSPPASPPSSPPTSPPASPPSSPPTSPPTSPPPPAPPPVTPQSQEDIVYGTGQTTGAPVPLYLDIYQSGETCTALRPYVLLIHGGGFTSGSRFFYPFPQLGTALADRGYVAVSIDYRLEGDNPVVSSEFLPVRNRLAQTLVGDPQLPALAWTDVVASAFEDTVRAIRWIEDNAADQCIDPNRFAILGSSAGAYIATYVSYALDEDNIDVAKPNVVIDNWGRLLLDNAITSTDPPLFILHGDADPVVPYSYAQELQAQADAAFLPYSFYTVTGAGHGWGDIDLQTTTVDGVPIQEVTLRFIDEHLIGATPNYEVRTVPQQGG